MTTSGQEQKTANNRLTEKFRIPFVEQRLEDRRDELKPLNCKACSPNLKTQCENINAGNSLRAIIGDDMPVFDSATGKLIEYCYKWKPQDKNKQPKYEINPNNGLYEVEICKPGTAETLKVKNYITVDAYDPRSEGHGKGEEEEGKGYGGGKMKGGGKGKKRMFNLFHSSKVTLMNMLQYTTLSILPVFALLTCIKYMIHDNDLSKGSLEIILESVSQLLLIIIAVWFINKIILCIPTYSGVKYKGFSETNFIVTFILIFATLEMNLYSKIKLLIERI
jgi:hypothetical protein